MAILKCKITEYEFSLDDIRSLIASDLDVDKENVTVNYVIGATGRVVKIKVKVDMKE